MPKIILLVNNAITRQASAENRGRKWELSEVDYRGHPMVARRGDIAITDYFRSSMSRYYSWRVGRRPNDYEDFAYLLPSSEKAFDDQATQYHSVGFNIENSSNLLSAGIPEVDTSMYNNFALAFLFYPVTSILYHFGAPISTIYPNSQTTQASYEFQVLNIEGSENQWRQASDANGITNFARELFDDPGWYNWQAFIMGDAAIGFDGPARKFPGIIGSGMINKMFYDHAFERHQVPVVAEASYNYYSQFFNTLPSNPYALDVPNFYAVSSVLSSPGGTSMYGNLYGVQQFGAFTEDISSINSVKGFLGNSVAPTSNSDATDVLLPGSPLTTPLVPATSEQPDSLLSRFERFSFSNATAPARAATRKINKHIGLPYQMTTGPDSIINNMNGRHKLFPYSIKIQFSDFMDTGLLDGASELCESLSEATPESNRRTEILSNFFLYEIMRANIANFVNSHPTNPTPTSDAVYEEIDFSAVVSDTESEENPLSYYGFDWMNPGDWETNSDGRQPYSLRAIDLTNLFKNIAMYQFDPNADQGAYGYREWEADTAYGIQGETQ